MNRNPDQQLAANVQAVLDRLRLRIRRYVWLEGLGWSIAYLAAAFWATLVVDWFFEPPPVARVVILAAVAIGFGWVVVGQIGRRAFVRLSDASMATILERRFRSLDDSLLTAVDLSGRRREEAEFDPAMFERTCREAEHRVAGLDVAEVFDPVPLRRSLGVAVLLAATLAAFGLLAPEALGVWTRRSLLMSRELWPRRTSLSVEGFDEGFVKVARGADLELIAKADARWPVVPRVVEVRYRGEGGARGRALMNRLGSATAGEPFQRYSHTFRGILAPITFELLGGDDRVDDLRIEVVDSPTLIDMRLKCDYPAYTGRPSRTLPTTGSTQLPQGTRVTVLAQANKNLIAVRIDTETGDETTDRRTLDAAALIAHPRSFEHTIDSLDADTNLRFTLSDTDGITGREPVRLGLMAVADQPPQMAVQLRGIGSAVTPEVRLPVAGRIADDYGVDRLWFEYAVDQAAPADLPVELSADHPTTLELTDEALDAAGLGLKPEAKLMVCLKAADRCTLGAGPNVGTSDRWLLDVVTADQLRSMLQSRELVLRQRFEAIVDEVTDTRDVLLQLDFSEDKESAEPDAADESDGLAEGAEPGDAPAASAASSLALKRLEVQRATTTTRKNSHETAGVADTFADIRLQLINNRIDTEEQNSRLQQGIVEPLTHIAEDMLPELRKRLESLEKHLADRELAQADRRSAREQADATLRAMRGVLGRMIELEDFQQAVELLREIIAAQEQLAEKTQERQKDKLRELLE